jgi:antitoxin VapB
MTLNKKSEEKDRLARRLADEIRRLQLRLAALPRLDDRTDEEILGYDDAGLPS